MPVLVAYASKHGSTQGIVERIAAILRSGGLAVDLAVAEDAGDPAGYDAFVIGSAVYGSRWMAPAAEFIRNNGALLTRRPGVAVQRRPGRAADTASGDAAPGLAALGDSIGAQDHHIFRGAIDASKLRGVEDLIRLFLPQGDFGTGRTSRPGPPASPASCAPDPATARALKCRP